MKPFKKLSALEKWSLVLAVALLLCLFPMSYALYMLVRLATAVIAGCWAYSFFNKGKTAYAVISGAVALLFQPFFKIALDREAWSTADVILALTIVCLILFRKS